MTPITPTNPDALPHIPGYTILEQLYSSSKTAVYRAMQQVRQLPVVIKLLRQVYPSFSDLVQFRNQYTITKNVTIPGIVRPLSLESYQNGYILVMEDCGSISLRKYCQDQPLTLVNGLEIARKLADILHHLHQNNVIHKDIKPANILIHPQSQQVKIIDFSIASLLPKETQEIQNPNILEGTLAYLAPEQTGRMNRGIDYRSDFYSLGVTLYELLTGQLPFRSEDPLELVHSHIAKIPVPPHQLNSGILPIVSNIILKLMAKNAENRYQSALGLKHDLEQCLRQWQETGTILEFDLGQRDLCDRFLIPEKLYGREQEVLMLLEAFKRVTNGTSELMLVAGFSGIGKTAVVNEVHKPITRQKGYFIKGKFDQFNRNIPFSAFVQALRDLMGELLSESDAQLAQWRSEILAALGENGQVIIEVIPELENVIGKQPPAPELSGSAAQNRFNLLFQKFIEVFTTPEHPLVIFLDDLQWADSASLQLMKILMDDQRYLLLLGAYRDHEVSPIHPFILTVEELKKAGKTVNTITLAPLNFSDTNQLIADTLHCSPELAHPLTEFIERKTQGNPFFMTQFLKALHEDGQIKFNRNQGDWECDIVEIQARSLTDDVVEFMAQQLQKLPFKTQQSLKLAACIGNQFDLETLAIVSEKSKIEVADALWKALQEGFILPQSEVYKFYLSPDQAPTNTDKIEISYRFLHDRVQQAAYSLIPDNQKHTTHYHIGQLLLQKISPEAREERIFELVNQLNSGTALNPHQIERDELAQLNLLACRKAKSGTAYQAVHEYAKIGLNFLGDEAWHRQYEMTLQFHQLAAEATAIICDFDAMYQWINRVIEQAKTVLDQVEVYLIKIQALTTQNKFLEAITCGQLIVKKLGIDFPESITFVEIQQAVEEIKALIGERPIEELFNLPPMRDTEKLAMIKIAQRMVPACYLANSPLFPLVATLQVKLSLQYGNSPISSTGYADYGIFILNFQKDIATSNQLGQLAYRLASSAKYQSIRAVTFVPVGLYLYHHQYHLRDTLPIFQVGYQVALEIGKLEYVGHNVHGLCVNSYWCGKSLPELETQIRAYHLMMLKFHLVTSEKYCLIFLETVLFVLQKSQQDWVISAKKDTDNTWISELLNSDDMTGIFYFYLHRATLRFLLGQITLAKTDAIQTRQYLAAGLATVCEAGFYFYDSLITLATLSESSPDLENQLQQVAENQANLQHWAVYAPMNYLHKWQLVEAEKYRLLGNKLEAIEMYDQAITGAKEHEYIQEEALGNELTAKFYLAWGKEKLAASYMQEAYYCYTRWGAKAKLAHLEQQYPQLLVAIFQLTPETLTSGVTIPPTPIKSVTSTSSGETLWLDFPAVMKAAQAISQEIELEKLLASLMQIVSQNAAAHKACFILCQDEQWFVVTDANQEKTEILKIPLDQYQEIPQRLIYSVARTQETAVFDNLSTAVQFAGDRYLTTHYPKSVLCTPISRQGKLVGILYLENNLTVGAFTRDRINILQLLTSQAAISLENAYLYQKIQNYSQTLEAKVEEKTQALNQKAQDLEQTLKKLQQTQAQLIHTEKMSSLGQLVAGMAHEINNPINFIKGNITPTKNYIDDLMSLLNLYQQKYPQPDPTIQAKIEEIDLNFLFEDLNKILESMEAGSDRISQIVQIFRNFSRLDEAEFKKVDIHLGIDSTLSILQHRLKGDHSYPEIQIVKEYSKLPLIKCYASALNQVFINVLNNAIDALREAQKTHFEANKKSTVIIRTWIENTENIVISIADNGLGIDQSVLDKIFDPFFTTKPVGKGTGLGLSVSYSIIVDKHHGQFSCISQPGEGAEFIIKIPV